MGKNGENGGDKEPPNDSEQGGEVYDLRKHPVGNHRGNK